MDKNWSKNSVGATTIHTNNYDFFSIVHLLKVGKIENKRTNKVLLITNLRKMKQYTNFLTVQSDQININTSNC